jgi:hypothetical protein
MADIRNILETICKLSNEFIQNTERRSDDWVTLSSIVDHNGAVNEATRDRVVMTLYNISRENTIASYTPAQRGGDEFAIVKPPVYINLHLMLMANFSDKNYPDGLAAISQIISYFQQNPTFDQANAPDLAPGIEKLTMEMENLSPVDVNYVMSMLGTKYLPSVFYKLRLLPFAGNAMQARTYPIMSAGMAETPSTSGPV